MTNRKKKLKNDIESAMELQRSVEERESKRNKKKRFINEKCCKKRVVHTENHIKTR